MAWQAYELWNAPAALSILGIGMTIPTIAFLLPGGVLSDRLDRRQLMLCADLGRAVVVGVLAALVAHRARSRSGSSSCSSRSTASARRSSRRPSRRSSRTSCPPRDLAAGERARPVRAPDRATARRAGARRCARRRLGHGRRVRDRRRVVRRLGRRRRLHAPADARLARNTSTRRSAPCKEGFRFVRGRRLALGDAPVGRDRLSRVHRPDRGAPAVRRQERARTARRGDLGLVFAAGGIGAVGAALYHGAARPSEARRDRHVRVVDARDARGRRLRPCDRRPGS